MRTLASRSLVFVAALIVLVAASSFRDDRPAPQEKKPPCLVKGAKEEGPLLQVGQRIRFITANGVQAYDGVFTVRDGYGSWALVEDARDRTWWVNLNDIEAFELVP